MNRTLILAIGIYYAVISFASVCAAVIDKRRARRRGARRIPEATLLGLAFVGGALFMYLTMLAVRHKTLHPKFMIGLPAIMLLHASVFAAVVFCFDLSIL